jgi:hypothetical protein
VHRREEQAHGKRIDYRQYGDEFEDESHGWIAFGSRQVPTARAS